MHAKTKKRKESPRDHGQNDEASKDQKEISAQSRSAIEARRSIASCHIADEIARVPSIFKGLSHALDCIFSQRFFPAVTD